MITKKTGLLLTTLIIILLIGSVTVAILLQSDNSRYSVFFVNADDDDSRTFIAENSDLGYGDEDGEWALLQLSPSYSFGVRFTNVTIPKHAKITKAHIELFSVGTPWASHPNCLIYGDNSDNAVNFTVQGVLDRCGRNYTDSSVLWNDSVGYHKWIRTPSVHAILQEIVNRDDWVEGNPIAFLFITNGLREFSASFQNFESGYSSALVVKWENTL